MTKDKGAKWVEELKKHQDHKGVGRKRRGVITPRKVVKEQSRRNLGAM